jgi:hypothetical protein
MNHKPLCSISRSEKWGKKIQAAAYNGTRTVYTLATKIAFMPILPKKVYLG